jgi:hypothetical protein
MRFEQRARRAVQDIHRAVEVMEMSDTKTPQRLTRFDEYRARRTRNQRIAAIAVGLGLPLVLLIVAVRFLGMDPESGTPGGQPSTSPSPTPVTGRSVGFEAPFTYTLPAGWTLGSDGERYFGFEGPGSAHLMALSSVVPARSDCSDRPMPGVGTSSDAMTRWLARHPALDTTGPINITLGAASGRWLDVRLAEDWERSCPDGLTLVTGRPEGEESWEIYPNERIRLYVLDVPSGDTVTIVTGNVRERIFHEVIDEAVPVVESFEFTG